MLSFLSVLLIIAFWVFFFFLVLERSYLSLFRLAAALLEKASRPDSLSDMLSVVLFGFLNFFLWVHLCETSRNHDLTSGMEISGVSVHLQEV